MKTTLKKVRTLHQELESNVDKRNLTRKNHKKIGQEVQHEVHQTTYH